MATTDSVATNPFTQNFDPSLGTAFWLYNAGSGTPAAQAQLSVFAVALTEDAPLDLQISHIFVSKVLTSDQQSQANSTLSAILEKVGAINIVSDVIQKTSVCQYWIASYTIQAVAQADVDTTTTRIAKGCEALANELATLV